MVIIYLDTKKFEAKQLVGVMIALSDGVRTVYFHCLLVHSDYQGKEIGRELISRMVEVLGLCKEGTHQLQQSNGVL